MFAAEIRKKRVSRMRTHTHWRWRLDEVYVKINGEMHYLWRAVDPEARLASGSLTRLGDEHHVDVGDVVQLATTGLAHRDDRQAAGLGGGRQTGGGHRQPRLQRVAGQVRQRLGNLAQIQVAGQVAPRDGEELAAVGVAQRRYRVDAGEPGTRAGHPGDGPGDVRPDRQGQPRSSAARVVVADERTPVGRLRYQVLGQRRRHAEQTQQAGAQLLAPRERRAQRVTVGAGDDRGESAQRCVRVGCAAEGGNHRCRVVVDGCIRVCVPPQQRLAG